MKPLVTMPDVLLACGELNKRERVAVQWVIDRCERERNDARAPNEVELSDAAHMILAARILEEHRRYAQRMAPDEWALLAAHKVTATLREWGLLNETKPAEQ